MRTLEWMAEQTETWCEDIQRIVSSLQEKDMNEDTIDHAIRINRATKLAEEAVISAHFMAYTMKRGEWEKMKATYDPK